MINLLPGWDTLCNCCCHVYDCTAPCRQTMDDLPTNCNTLRLLRGTLMARVEGITSRIQTEEGHGRMLSPEVDNWCTLSGDLLTEITRLIGPDNEPRPLPSRCPGGCFFVNCCSAHTLAIDVRNSLTKVNQQLDEQHPEDQIFIINPNAVIEEDDYAAGDADDTSVSLIVHLNKVLEYLGRPGFGCVGIYGMGGVGKTELLTRIYVSLRGNLMEYKREKIVMVDMTNAHDLPSARQTIYEKLYRLIPDQNVDLKGTITRALQNYNFVLLLDDLQLSSNEILKNLGIPMTGAMSKVLFTTRDEVLCLHMGKGIHCDKIEMGCLTNEESWILFQKEVGEETLNSDEGIEGVAQEISNLCRGMPLALVTIGGAMRGKNTLGEWEYERNSLRQLDLSSNDSYVNMLKLLERSYDRLEDTDNNPRKSCFLYASLFPTMYLPEQEELVDYWLAEGFLRACETPNANLDHGRNIIPQLRRVNLFNHDTRSRTVNMHDMIRAAALSTLRNSCYVRTRTLVELPENTDWSQVERISLVGVEISELKAHRFSRLSTLFLQKSTIENIFANFFDEMPSLRVLNMSGCKMNGLPQSVTKLTALQYLNVSHTEISDLPSGFENLKMLRFLNLSHLPNLGKIPPQAIASFSELVKLDLYNSGTKGRTNATTNTALGNVSSEDDTALIEVLKALRYLCDLSLTLKSKSSIEGLFESKKLLKSLHRVYITMCSDLKTLVLPSFGYVENLEVLCVYNCSNLANFKITMMDKTQVVPDPRAGSVPSRRSFKTLHEIEIVNCPGIQDISWIKYVLELQSLKIETYHGLTVVISGSTSIDIGVPGIYQDIRPILSKLKTIYLDDLSLLTHFCDNPLNLSSLEEIRVISCSNMMKLPLLLENKEKLKSININEKAWDALEWDNNDIKETFKPLCKFN